MCKRTVQECHLQHHQRRVGQNVPRCPLLRGLLGRGTAGVLSAVNERMNEDGREGPLHPKSLFVRRMLTLEGKLSLSCESRLELDSREG